MIQELLDQFNKETGIHKPVDTNLDYYQSQYIIWLEQRLVNKNDLLPDVSNRRELLIAFLREYHTSMLVFDEMPDIEMIVDDYLKSN